MAGIPFITGAQDPSQLDATINGLIENLNGYLTGTSGSPITSAVSAASTAAAIAAQAGQVTVNSTTRTAGTTGRYSLAAPQTGVQLKITSLSTVKSTVTGLFERSKTKLSFTSTAALSAGAKLPSIILTGLSTSAWGVTAGYGNVALDVKIGILGSAPSFHQAPFSDPSWELWACNIGTVPRWDRWFDLHDDASIDAYEGHRAFLTSRTKPVYTRQNFPVARLTAKYGTWFFTSTIAYMLAMALEECPDEIGLWGVDMADATEYGAQKQGCRFFIQIARMAGIKVTLPEGCEISVPGRLYSLDGPSWLEGKLAARKAELVGRFQQNEGRKQSLILEKAALMGRQKITLTDEQIAARLIQIVTEMEQAERDGLVLDGALQETTHHQSNWIGN